MAPQYLNDFSRDVACRFRTIFSVPLSPPLASHICVYLASSFFHPFFAPFELTLDMYFGRWKLRRLLFASFSFLGNQRKGEKKVN